MSEHTHVYIVLIQIRWNLKNIYWHTSFHFQTHFQTLTLEVLRIYFFMMIKDSNSIL